jgi:Thiamine pyrophosphate enzyme, N-terminal TPP binding domain
MSGGLYPCAARDNAKTAAEVLVDQLIINGVAHVLCVPGESYLAVLDAFHDRKLAVTVCRQEGGAAMMAEAVASTGGAFRPIYGVYVARSGLWGAGSPMSSDPASGQDLALTKSPVQPQQHT